MAEPIKYVNANGDVRWQPNAENGDRLMVADGRKWCGPNIVFRAWTYRSRKRAVRISGRYDRRVAKKEFRQFSDS